MKLAPILSILYSYFFGYDIFISYTRADAEEYATKLNAQLSSLDYSSFLDRKEAPSGLSLNSSLFSAIRGSKAFVLVGTERALGRDYVQLEFKEFAKTSRPIIPINVNSALTQERLKFEPWNIIADRDIIWIDETSDALGKGLPSPDVYEGIQNLFNFTRRNVIRRRWITAIALIILGVSLFAIFQARDARAQKQFADEQRKIVEEQTGELAKNRDDLQTYNNQLQEQQKSLLEQQKSLEEKNQELQSNKDLLEKKTKEALENSRKAEEKEALALENARKAEEQKRIAVQQKQIAEQQTREATQAKETAGIRYIEQLANSIGNLYPERKVLVLLEALRRNRGETGDEAFLEQGLRNALDALYGSTPMRHSGLTAVDLSPDGRWLATGSEDGLVRLWDLSKDDPQSYILGSHVQEIARLKFSPDSRWLISGCRDYSGIFVNPKIDGTARVWQVGVPSSQPIILEKAGSGEAVDFAFSPNVDILAVRFGNGRVWLWKYTSSGPSGAPIDLLEANQSAQTIAFSRDGKWFVTGNEDGAARLWLRQKLFDGAPPYHLPSSDTKEIWSTTFSPDGRWLVTTNYRSQTARVWRLNESEPDSNPIDLKVQSMYTLVRNIEFSPNSRWLVIQVEDEDLRLWRIPQHNQEKLEDFTLRGHKTELTAAAFSSDSQKLASGSRDGMVRVWNLTLPNPTEESTLLAGHERDINKIGFSPNNNLLYTASADWTIRSWDLNQLNKEPTILSHEGGVNTLFLTPDARSLLTVSLADKRAGFVGAELVRRFRLTPLQSPQPARTLAWINKGRYSWKSSPDGKWIMSETEYQAITLVGISDENQSKSDYPIPRECDEPCFSPDSKWLVSHKGNELFFTRLSDVQTIKLPNPLSSNNQAKNQDAIRDTVFDPTGRWLVVMFDNGEGALHSLSMTESPQFIAPLTLPEAQRIPYENDTAHL